MQTIFFCSDKTAYKMKFIVSSLFLALLVVAANAASLEKVEKIENAEAKVATDKVEPASAEAPVPTPALKTESVEIVEAKSAEPVEVTAIPAKKDEPEAPVAVLKAIAPETVEPAVAEQSEKVRDVWSPSIRWTCVFWHKIYDFII